MSETISSPLDALTEALVESNDRLLGLIGLTERVAMSLDEEQLLGEVVSRAIDILNLDGVGLQLTADGSTTHRTWGEVSSLPFANSPGWSQDRDLGVYGSLGITASRHYPPLATGDTKVLTAVTNLLASNVRIARMHADALRQAVVASEHDTAARITTASLQDPASPPIVKGLTVHAHLTPARTTGGDLWAWHQTADEFWFAVGDVSGKGLPAAVMMATIVTATRDAFVRHAARGPVSIVDAVARQIFNGLSNAGMFTTFLVGRWDRTGELQVANAGHSPALVVRDGIVERIEATVPPIGVIEEMSPTVWRTVLAPGDAVVVATDGFTEQRNTNGHAFGEDEFDEAVARVVCTARDADMIGESLVANLINHTGSADADDDRTLLVLHANLS